MSRPWPSPHRADDAHTVGKPGPAGWKGVGTMTLRARAHPVSIRPVLQRPDPVATANLRVVFVHTPMATLSLPHRQVFWQNFDRRYHAVHPGLQHMRRNLWELPHWMTWLAGVLVAEGYTNLRAVDFYASECAFAGINRSSAGELLRQEPGEVFLFSPMTPNLPFALELAELVKEIYPRSKTIFGGVVATPIPQAIASHQCVDFVVHGRGEHALPRLLDAIVSKQGYDDVGNLCLRTAAGDIVTTSGTYPWIAPADLPFPKVDLFPPDIGQDVRYLRQVYALGCPYACPMCTIQTIGRRPGYFPINRVMEEIRAYRAHYGSHHNIYFGDETFTLHRDRTLALCSALREAGDVTYDCQTRINLLDDDDMLDALYESGCRWVEVGIESVDQQTQDLFKQHAKLGSLKTSLARLRDHGIAACSFLVNGFPNQTVDGMRRSIDYAADLISEGYLHASYLFGLVPYPGSDMYTQPERYGMQILHHDFKWYLEDGLPVYRTAHAQPHEMYRVFLDGLLQLGEAMGGAPYLGTLYDGPGLEEFGAFWQDSHV